MLLSDQQMQVSEAKTQGDIATRPPVPPFTSETAIQKVRMAEEAGILVMRFRYACINDLPIKESDRKYHWPVGRRPDAHPGLSDLGL